jgi:hypothetical protein
VFQHGSRLRSEGNPNDKSVELVSYHSPIRERMTHVSLWHNEIHYVSKQNIGL